MRERERERESFWEPNPNSLPLSLSLSLSVSLWLFGGEIRRRNGSLAASEWLASPGIKVGHL
jgi:hypothetical protein